MRRIRAWAVRFAGLFDTGRADRELADELESHLQMQIDDNVRLGMTRGEARRQALIRLGSIESAKERCRDRRGIPAVEHFAQDLRFGLRMLARSPVLTAAAVLTLAVGIGANAAVFSLWNQALLVPLPVTKPQDLVEVQLVSPSGARFDNLNYPEFRVFGDERRVFSNALLYGRSEADLHVNGQWQRVNAQFVTGSFYRTLGVEAVMGRTIGDADEQSAARVAVLSHACWTRRFGQDSAVVGKTVDMNGSSYVIIGVTSRGFFGVDRLHPLDIAVPITAGQKPAVVWCVGRLRPGVALPQARAAMAALMADVLDQQRPRIEKWPPSEQEQFLGLRLDLRRVGAGSWDLQLMLARPLPLLTVAFGVLLLIACVNVANLLLARASARSAEISTRLAIGASRRRLVRQFLTESLLLGVCGGTVGLLVALVAQRLSLGLLPIDPNAAVHVNLDIRVLGFTTAVSLFTGVLFGTLPALRLSAVEPYSVMKSATPTGSQRRLRPSRALLVFQVTVSFVLLVAAALLVRTLRNLEDVDAGFDRDHLLLLTVTPAQSQYRDARMIDLYDELFGRVGAVSGVRSVALARGSLFGARAQKTIWVSGYAYAPRENQMTVFNLVGPGFFSTAGIPFVMGRDFRLVDRSGAGRVAIVNEAFIRKYLAGQNPLGRRFGDAGPSSAESYEIVGVVKDAKYWTLREAAQPAVFQPLWQDNGGEPFIVHVRTFGAPGAVAGRVREFIQSIDNDLIVSDVRTMADQVSDTLQLEHALAVMSTLIGAVALLLTCVGLYGVTAYSVARRTREIGIRVALGARPGHVLRMVLGESCLVAIVGLAIGIPVALAASRVLASVLFGLPPDDPVAVVVAALLMLAVAGVAAFLPARRAARVAPGVALRYE